MLGEWKTPITQTENSLIQDVNRYYLASTQKKNPCWMLVRAKDIGWLMDETPAHP